MPSADLTPLYYSDAQMASMLTPSLDNTPSPLAIPTNMSGIQQDMLAQNINNTAFPTTSPPMAKGGMPRRYYHAAHEQMYKNIIQHFAKGGLSNPEAEQVLQTHLNNTKPAIQDTIEADPHIMDMFGIQPTARPVAQGGTAETLAAYDTPQGKSYLADRAAMPKTPTHIHDIINPPTQHFAKGGQVGVLHKFKSPLPAQSYVNTPHYRQTFKNPDLTKVRTEMRVR